MDPYQRSRVRLPTLATLPCLPNLVPYIDISPSLLTQTPSSRLHHPVSPDQMASFRDSLYFASHTGSFPGSLPGDPIPDPSSRSPHPTHPQLYPLTHTPPSNQPQPTPPITKGSQITYPLHWYPFRQIEKKKIFLKSIINLL